MSHPSAARAAPGLPLMKLSAGAVWPSAVAAILVLLVGAIGFRMKQPWLFAGLAPSIFMVANNPGQESSRVRAVVGGHLAALACAYVALFLFTATGAWGLLAKLQVAPPRVWASAIALALLAFVQPQLRVYHPPAAATALLVTLGAYRLTGKTPLALMGGVVVIALASEVLQRVRR